MNTRFYNARILTVSDCEIKLGEVWVEGSKIAYCGEKKASDITFDREIDLDGNVIMPSFKNAHTHSAMTFLRSYADDLPLDEWLHTAVFPMEAKLTGEDVYWLTKLAVMEYLTSGTSACFDMYMKLEDAAKAVTECGFRMVMSGAVNNFNDDALGDLEKYYNRFNNYNELVSYKLGFHAEYTTSINILEGISEIAHKYKAPVYAHNSETASEVKGCIDRYGKTPTELMESLGLFDFGGGGYHCVHMSQNDLDIFKQRGLYAVTNPASNCKLASGIAPLAKMSQMGIRLAIGTDGPASNNALDMFREMYLAYALQNISCCNAAAFSPYELLKMATSGGAMAMGLESCDDIAVGKSADLIVIDLKQPNMQPLNNIPKNIVYSGSKQNVVLTMVNGRILYENGIFNINADPQEIYSKSNEITERIKTS